MCPVIMPAGRGAAGAAATIVCPLPSEMLAVGLGAALSACARRPPQAPMAVSIAARGCLSPGSLNPTGQAAPVSGTVAAVGTGAAPGCRSVTPGAAAPGDAICAVRLAPRPIRPLPVILMRCVHHAERRRTPLARLCWCQAHVLGNRSPANMPVLHIFWNSQSVSSALARP